MTTLEIILTAVVWIAYGLFNAYQVDEDDFEFNRDTAILYLIIIALAPSILVVRIVLGIFSSKIL
jgi:hypothetical protein